MCISQSKTCQTPFVQEHYNTVMLNLFGQSFADNKELDIQNAGNGSFRTKLSQDNTDIFNIFDILEI